MVISSLQGDASRVMNATRSTCLKSELSTSKKPNNLRVYIYSHMEQEIIIIEAMRLFYIHQTANYLSMTRW